MTGDGKWSGVNDGEPWAVEVDVDRMAPSEPFTVSVWVGPCFVLQDPKANVEGAFLSANEAREMASVLLAAAEAVDFNNARPEVVASLGEKERRG